MMAKRKPEPKQFTVRMREEIERVYVVEANDETEAREKAMNYDSDFSHEDGVINCRVLSVEEDGA